MNSEPLQHMPILNMMQGNNVLSHGNVSDVVSHGAVALGKVLRDDSLSSPTHSKANGDLGRRQWVGLPGITMYRVSEPVPKSVLAIVAAATGIQIDDLQSRHIVVNDSLDPNAVIHALSPLLDQGHFVYRPFADMGVAPTVASHFSSNSNFQYLYPNDETLTLNWNNKSSFRDACGPSGLNILVDGQVFDLHEDAACQRIVEYCGSTGRPMFFKFTLTFSSAGNGIINPDGSFETKDDRGQVVRFDTFHDYYQQYVEPRKELIGKVIVEECLETDDLFSSSYSFFIHPNGSIERITPTVQRFKDGFYDGNVIIHDHCAFPQTYQLNQAMQAMGTCILSKMIDRSKGQFAGRFYTGDGNVDFGLLKPSETNIALVTNRTKSDPCLVRLQGVDYILYPFEINARQGGATMPGLLDRITHGQRLLLDGHFSVSGKISPSPSFLANIADPDYHRRNFALEELAGSFILKNKLNFSAEEGRAGIAGISACGPDAELNYVLNASNYGHYQSIVQQLEAALGIATPGIISSNPTTSLLDVLRS